MTTLEELRLKAPPAAGFRDTAWAYVDDDGNLVLPPEVVAKLGLTPGAQLRVEEIDNGLRLHRPITHLAKLYIEPTDACNLGCVTCFRNAWDEPMGRMSDATFAAILESLASLDGPPTVYFGGIGEPLFHPRTTQWIAQTKQLGARVEMITNGTLLSQKRCQQLIDAGLDLIWISIDGSSPERFADVRLGAELPKVIANVKRLRSMRSGFHLPKPEIGVAFVAMKRNIADLPNVLALARHIGAMQVSVSNVLPINEAMQGETLYDKTLHSVTYIPSSRVPRLSLPKIDFDETTREALIAAFDSGYNVSYAGSNWGGRNDVCDFVEKGSMTVAWNGDVSPCWPLMHTHNSYLHGKPHRTQRHVVGNVRERSLSDLWLDPEYVAYRQRVQSFAFPPCTYCGGCELSVSNEEDCIGNEFPVCGTCMWAQGVVMCP